MAACESNQVYTEPTVLLAKRVSGEEEVPEGAVAVLTPDAPDVLSHVSVRARNMKVLFAVCHAAEPLKELEGLAGKTLALKTSAAGNVTWEEVHFLCAKFLRPMLARISCCSCDQGISSHVLHPWPFA